MITVSTVLRKLSVLQAYSECLQYCSNSMSPAAIFSGGASLESVMEGTVS